MQSMNDCISPGNWTHQNPLETEFESFVVSFNKCLPCLGLPCRNSFGTYSYEWGHFGFIEVVSIPDFIELRRGMKVNPIIPGRHPFFRAINMHRGKCHITAESWIMGLHQGIASSTHHSIWQTALQSINATCLVKNLPNKVYIDAISWDRYLAGELRYPLLSRHFESMIFLTSWRGICIRSLEGTTLRHAIWVALVWSHLVMSSGDRFPTSSFCGCRFSGGKKHVGCQKHGPEQKQGLIMSSNRYIYIYNKQINE